MIRHEITFRRCARLAQASSVSPRLDSVIDLVAAKEADPLMLQVCKHDSCLAIRDGQ
jgi:hypothetical protein